MTITYFILTQLSWITFIVLDCIMDSIIFHVDKKWYRNLVLWHRLKYFRIGFSVGTGVFACLYMDAVAFAWLNGVILILVSIIVRLILFETLINKFAGRI